MLANKKSPNLSLGDLLPAAPRNPSSHGDPGVLPISAFVIVFRAPDPANVKLPLLGNTLIYARDCVGFTDFSFHRPSLREAKYPLCFDAIVNCLADNPFGMKFFTKTGGGGPRPLPHQADLAALKSALLRAIRDFPRGWTEEEPKEIESETRLEDHINAADRSA